jgi:arsenate reductase (glutaredoxin)
MTTVFYNAACSKCRRVREILDERSESYELVEYLKAPPDRQALEGVVARLGAAPAALVRRDGRFAELGLREADYATAEKVVALLLEHPELLERPVVVRGNRAVVARPPARVLELLDHQVA